MRFEFRVDWLIEVLKALGLTCIIIMFAISVIIFYFGLTELDFPDYAVVAAFEALLFITAGVFIGTFCEEVPD